jgi:hypothetical protein
MRIPDASALCDAVELAALQLGQQLSEQDLAGELGTGMPPDQFGYMVNDALGIAAERSAGCMEGYPFEVTGRTIRAKRIEAFSPYLFLLIGSSLKHSCARKAPALRARFRKHFEDFVSWSLRKAGFRSEVLSEPRGERQLPRSLKPALLEIAARFGEEAELVETNLTADDNDLGVDVLATFPLVGAARSGRPVFLLQCATGHVENLETKLPEKQEVFPDVWQRGFYASTAIRGGATPVDLLRLRPVDWHRLCKIGWVLDRVRLVQLAHYPCGAAEPIPSALRKLWQDLLSSAPELDWRNGWRESLPDST